MKQRACSKWYLHSKLWVLENWMKSKLVLFARFRSSHGTCRVQCHFAVVASKKCQCHRAVPCLFLVARLQKDSAVSNHSSECEPNPKQGNRADKRSSGLCSPVVHLPLRDVLFDLVFLRILDEDHCSNKRKISNTQRFWGSCWNTSNIISQSSQASYSHKLHLHRNLRV
jgi:hypothetical protein